MAAPAPRSTSGAAKGRDRRKWPRIALDAEALLRFTRFGPEVNARLVNVSEKGLFLAMDRPRPLGTKMRVTIYVAESRLEMRVSGIVVHVVPPDSAEKSGIGLLLTDIPEGWTAFCEQASAGAPKP